MFFETSYSDLSDVSLTPTQQDIAARIVAIGQSRGESQKHIQAALATGWVESRFRNLSAGDRDSAGVMQQRPSQGWGTYQQVTNLDYAINAFYDAAGRVNDSNLSFGQLAQAVQRSGFPARYGQAGSIVSQLLNLFGMTGGEDSNLDPETPAPIGDPAAVDSSTLDPLGLGLGIGGLAILGLVIGYFLLD